MIESKKWKNYGRKAKFLEINVKDNENQTIDYFKLQKGKNKDIKRILKKIKEQYGFDLDLPEEDWFLNKDMVQ